MYDDDSDVSLANDSQVCQACLGKERWEEGHAWLECAASWCSLWFHKDCISENFASKSIEELAAYQFYCKSYVKKLRRKTTGNK